MEGRKEGRRQRRRNGGAEGAEQSGITTSGGKMKKNYIFSGGVGRDDGDLWRMGGAGRGGKGRRNRRTGKVE